MIMRSFHSGPLRLAIALVLASTLASACELDEGGLLPVVSGTDAAPDAAMVQDAPTNVDACSMCGTGQCIDLSSDPNNCGACGNICAPGASCIGGACACGTGSALCSGTCRDLRADAQNCGACGNVCGAMKPPLTGGGVWACSESQCTIMCTAPLSACAGGCFDLTTDHDNCGQCGSSCNSETCCSGACANTQDDNANCGTCGSTCSGTCESGSCCTTPTEGTCTHDLCSTGSALSSSCDGTQGCVAKVCAADSYCCSNKWDSTCTWEVATYCSPLQCSC